MGCDLQCERVRPKITVDKTLYQTLRNCFVFVMFWIPSVASSQITETLFLEKPEAYRASAIPSGMAAKRYRKGQLNQKALVPQNPAKIALNLFDDANYLALIERSSSTENGFIHQGTIAGLRDSLVIIANEAGVVAATVFVPGQGTFKVQYAGHEQHEITEIDPAKLPQCGLVKDSLQPSTPIAAEEVTSHRAPPATLKTQLSAEPQRFSANTSTPSPIPIDVMVLYTSQALDGAGGVPAINTLIDLAIAEANLAFRNSEINMQLQLVHRELISYSESGNSTNDLDCLVDKNDGFLDEAHTLRDLYHVDLVCLFTETSSPSVAGIAHIMTSPMRNFESRGFSVVQRSYATGNNVFAHELGHNMGCMHDRENSSRPGVFSYSYGYRFVANGGTYRDVMAYQPGTGIFHFSNPDVSYQGVPTGVPEGATNAADNAKSINKTAPIVSTFRAWPTVSITSPTNGQVFIAPTNLVLSAAANSSNGQIVQVEFHIGSTSLGITTNEPFHVQWVNPAMGTYEVTAQATTEQGFLMRSAPVTVVIGKTLHEALDAPNIIWSNADSPWFGQVDTTRDGVDAAQSGDADKSSLQTIVTGPGKLSFWWKLIGGGFAWIGFFDNDVQQYQLTQTTDWKYEVTDIPPGKHTLRWTYLKILGEGTKAWLDEVSFEPMIAPTIVSSPPPQSVIQGTDAAFAVVVTGDEPLTFQWRFNGTNIPGETNAALVITNAQTTNSGNYTVLVQNLAGSAESSDALLTVVAPPMISQQPISQSVLLGADVTFSVGATGVGPVYQWRLNGTNISGATASSYTISGVSAVQAGSYSVVISNLAGTITSSNATLHVNSPARIVLHPQSQAVPIGTNITLSVTAAGSFPLTYQWRKNATNNLKGATMATYTIAHAQLKHSGDYSVVVSNDYGSQTSFKAVLSIYLCDYSIAPAGAVFSSIGTNAAVTVISSNACPWSVVNTNDWITITGGTNGSGNQNVNYSVSPNPGFPRAGFITVAGKTHAVIQTGTVPPGRFDFSGDNLTDLLLQRPTDSALAFWKMDGTNFISTSLLRPEKSPTGWRACGEGDFNGDGKTDILLYHDSTRRVAAWLMNGTNFIRNVILRTNAAAVGWRAVSAADFNNDGKADVLLQHDTRKIAVWLMNGTNFSGAVSLRNGATPAAGWEVVGTGDFNGDGQTEILWRNTMDNRTLLWHFVGTTFTSASFLRTTGPAVSTGWKVCGAGDIDNDAHTDVVLQNMDGRVAAWLFNRTNFVKTVTLRKGNPAWQIVGPR